MRLRSLTLVILALVAASDGKAQTHPAEPAVQEAVQRYIDAMMRRDTTYLRGATLPRATFVSRSVPGDTLGERDVDTFIAGIGRERRQFVGRVWDPRISVEGPMALFVAPYAAWYDGRLSHCGIDHYVLVQQGDRWLVSHLAFTRQRDGCALPRLEPDPAR